MVCRAGVVFGEPFKAGQGVTQGGPLLYCIFNVVVDAVVREWLQQVLGEEAVASGYGLAIRNFLAIFYTRNAMVASRCPQQLQDATNILVRLFDCIGLRTNTLKTKVIICVPGKIRTRLTSTQCAPVAERA